MESAAAFSTVPINVCFWSKVTDLDDQKFTFWVFMFMLKDG